ncbi:contractile injection system tape measure protein [Cytophagaceae bacterium ABcell3]|nr:contractile injection system tape measure protein [Cytophagaceae bacterium ABcell3]
MTSSPGYLIHKVFLELKVSDQSVAYSYADNIKKLLENELLPELEKLLAEFEHKTGGRFIQIDCLNVQLRDSLLAASGGLDQHSFFQRIKSDFIEQLRKQLVEGVNLETKDGRALLKEVPQGDREIQTVLYILKHGHKPWWLGDSEEVLFFSNWDRHNEKVKNFLRKPGFQDGLVKGLANKRFLNRLINQMSSQQLEFICEAIAKGKFKADISAELEKIADFIKPSGSNTSVLWELILATFDRERFVQVFQETVPKLSRGSFKTGLPERVLSILQIAGKLHRSNYLSQPNFSEPLSLLVQDGGEQNLESSENKVKEINDNKRPVKEPRLSEGNIKAGRTEEDSKKEGFKKKAINKEPEGKAETGSRSVMGKPGAEGKERGSSLGFDRGTPNTEKGTPEHGQKNDSAKQRSFGAFSEREYIEEETFDEIFVSHAGLVLLHPFFKNFFQKTGLLEGKELVDKAMAAHLLHYVATKTEQAFEHEMLFEKFCCNIPVGEPLPRNILLTDEMKREAENLLDAVRVHWKALKGTSSDTLRAEFLSRKGKLMLKGNFPKLIVERKVQDILLDKLPWGIGMAKFPWKKEMVFVEW